jgi:lipopolysaccharide/colanic/teichoic acid biosynthesis glycosyltransferase
MPPGPRLLQWLLKRALDLVAAGGGLLLLSPLLFIVGVCIRLTMGAPVLFRQSRPGLHEKLFTLYKFRTMLDARTPEGRLLQDKERLTRLGHFLRKKSLDELPQLYNVIKGEMSLIGPRPLLVAYLNRYTPRQHRRHEVKPGITGWGQVNGRQDLKLSQRIELDIWYVENQSLLLDLKILLRTVLVVVRGTGIQPGQGPRGLDDLPPAPCRVESTSAS